MVGFWRGDPRHPPRRWDPQLSPLGARQGGPCYLIKPINEWAKKAANTA
jgi:hypothetical protein